MAIEQFLPNSLMIIALNKIHDQGSSFLLFLSRSCM